MNNAILILIIFCILHAIFSVVQHRREKIKHPTRVRSLGVLMICNAYFIIVGVPMFFDPFIMEPILKYVSAITQHSFGSTLTLGDIADFRNLFFLFFGPFLMIFLLFVAEFLYLEPLSTGWSINRYSIPLGLFPLPKLTGTNPK